MASENIINRFSKTYDWNTSTKKVDNTKEVEAQKNNIIKKTITEVIDKFIKGNMTLEELAVWCLGNNCEVTTATQSSTAYTISFKFQGKTYKVVSNIEAAKSSTDDITTLTFTKADLLNKYKLNGDAISTYFSEVANVDGGEKQYAFKSSYASKFADINDFLTYYNTRNNLIMYNYANNKITDKNGDATAKALYTNTIDKTLSTSNYTKYADKVDDLVPDPTKLTQQALDKFVSEFSAGKVDYDQITTILDAANIKDVHKTTLANGKINFEFTFNGKTYKINTNSKTESDAINTALKSVTNKTTTTKSDGTKTVTTTNDDGTKLTQVYYANGKMKSETLTKANGKKDYVTTYNEDGTMKTKTNYGSNGKAAEVIAYTGKNQVSKTTYYKYNADNVKIETTVKNANGQPTKITCYNDAGETTKVVSYTYSSGKLSKKVTKNYSDPKDTDTYTQYTYKPSTGAVTRKDVKDGKDVTKTGKSQIKGKGKISKSKYGITITKTTEQVYNAIIGNLNKSFISVLGITVYTTREAIKEITGPLTVALLEAAQIGKGRPAGATKTYNTIPSEYKDFITNNIKNTVGKNYGYDPEDVKGYFFPSTSSQAKAIAGSSEIKNLVNDPKKLKSIVDKSGLPMGLKLSSTTDLANSISGCYIIDSDLSGNTLTLKIYDMYDFDPKYVSNLKTNTTSGSAVVNAAGAAAMMDGNLKPYYHITEVKITLTPAQLNSIK